VIRTTYYNPGEEQERKDDAGQVEIMGLFTRESPYRQMVGCEPWWVGLHFVPEEPATTPHGANAQHVWGAFVGDERVGTIYHYYSRRWAARAPKGRLQGTYTSVFYAIGALADEVYGRGNG
jgi:hypothetical protein